jgi:hypothetical protein
MAHRATAHPIPVRCGPFSRAGNLDARLSFTAPADSVYRVIVTQFDLRFGAYELNVRAAR